jgi:hypothetical protein
LLPAIAGSIFFTQSQFYSMRIILAATFLFLFNDILQAQLLEKIITVKEVNRIEQSLASDEMEGRKTFTPGIEKAADFISAEFKKAGLKPMLGKPGFRQTFTMVKPKQLAMEATIDGLSVDASQVVVVTPRPNITVTERSNYRVKNITKGSNYSEAITAIIASKVNTIVFVDTSYSKGFSRLAFLKRTLYANSRNLIFVLVHETPKTFCIQASHEINKVEASNIVGVLPGKSKKWDYVVFSGHYDHLGIGKPENGDSIYNGANDDASGITAVISMAKYYARKKQNPRTLIFVAFTAEEIGGYGSKYFSEQIPPEKVVAMFNIEMIGTESKWGRSSAYITGFEKSDMGNILQKNLRGSAFSFHPDPYPEQKLFYRSDNATLARVGVPAHTISTSKMDNEPNYHKLSDEISTLDMDNMTAIIRAIVMSARSIVSGRDTPVRIPQEK